MTFAMVSYIPEQARLVGSENEDVGDASEGGNCRDGLETVGDEGLRGGFIKGLRMNHIRVKGGV